MKGMIRCVHSETGETLAYLTHKEVSTLDPDVVLDKITNYWRFYDHQEYNPYYPLIKDLQAYLILKELRKEVLK